MTSSYFPGRNPLNYQGTNVTNPPQQYSFDRAPTPYDWETFNIGDEWRDSSTTPNDWYKLCSKARQAPPADANARAVWRPITAKSQNDLSTLTGNTGGAISPDSTGTINVIGTSGQINVAGSGNTLTLSLTGGGTAIDSVLVDSGGLVTPDSNGRISLVGSANIGVVASAAPTTQATVSVTGQIPVANGGTGAASFSNVNSVILSGATSTSALTSITSGASGTVLTSNGPGVTPSWSTNTANTQITYQKFVYTGSSQTYTRPANLTYAIVEVLGGGGGGGGAPATTSATNASAGGGGAGGYARSILSAATIGTSQTVTVGIGGAGGAAGNNSGTAGGTSSFGSLVVATGGSGGGSTSPLGFTSGVGGDGGIGTAGDILCGGEPGFNGWGFRNNEVLCFAISGHGASSIYGGGGKSKVAASAAGAAATNFGSGGSGGANASGSGSSDPAVAGGDGSPGIVIVTEFY
jgi:hypothetical protein